MTEGASLSPFEVRLARRFEAYADVPIRQLDAHVAAAVAAAAPRPRSRVRLAWPAWPVLRPLIVIAVLIALAASALLIAGMVLPVERAPGRLVYSSSAGGLYLANADGGNVRKVRDGRYGTPKWSPDGLYVAVQRDPDLLDILRADGTLIEELPSPGDFAWAPGNHVDDYLAAAVNGSLLVKHLDFGGNPIPPSAGQTVNVSGDDIGIGGFAWTSDSTLTWVSPDFARPQPTYALHAARIERQEYSITAVESAGIDIAVPAPPLYRSFGHLLLSPDGTQLATAARVATFLSSDLAVVPVNGGTLRPIAQKVQAYAWLEWSADSQSVIVETYDPGEVTHLIVVPLDGRAAYPLFPQAAFDDWLLVDDSPVDLEHGPILVGKVTSPADGGRLANAPVMDLYMLEGGTPRAIAYDVLGADVFWP